MASQDYHRKLSKERSAMMRENSDFKRKAGISSPEKINKYTQRPPAMIPLFFLYPPNYEAAIESTFSRRGNYYPGDQVKNGCQRTW